jgi:hypothetical protein
MHFDSLTTKQQRFINEYLVDANGAAAAARAGYATRSAKVAASRMLTKDNPVSRVIKARQDAESTRLGISRQEVIVSLLEAAELARAQASPMALIASAREIGKLLGFYAPDRVEVAHSAGANRTMEQIQCLSNAELLAVIAAGASEMTP